MTWFIDNNDNGNDGEGEVDGIDDGYEGDYCDLLVMFCWNLSVQF